MIHVLKGWIAYPQVPVQLSPVHRKIPPGVRFSKGFAALLSILFMISAREIGLKPPGRATGVGAAETAATREQNATATAEKFFISASVWRCGFQS